MTAKKCFEQALAIRHRALGEAHPDVAASLNNLGVVSDELADFAVSFDFHGVELMTLSACETAMGGGAENGREFEGFAALVQQRGVKAVIASLWPVADESTAPLMTAFYRARQAGDSKAAALQAAQLALLHGRYAHPYHWAPFVLLGNWL